MIELYTPQWKAKWDKLVEASKNGTFMLQRDYLEYHQDRFQDLSLVFFEKDRMTAILPANWVGNILWSHQGLSFGGLVVHNTMRLENVILYFREMLKFLSNLGIEILMYKQIPSFYHQYPCEEEKYILFLLEAHLFRRDCTTTLDLTKPLLPYQSRRTRSVKKAQLAKIEIRQTQQFSTFWEQLLVPNLKTKYNLNPVHSAEEMEKLATLFPENIKIFGAFDPQGKMQAGTVIYETPTVAHAQYIAASEEGKTNGSLDLLFDRLIQEVYTQKNYFDFGISNEDNGQKLNHGLLDWKEGFGGRTFTHDFYEIETKNFTKLDKVIRR